MPPANGVSPIATSSDHFCLLPRAGGLIPLEDTSNYLDAFSSLEQALAGLFCRALGLDQVGLQDDFFELGGDSLAAIQVCVSLEQVLGQDLPPTALVQAPTVAQLARLLGQQRPTRAGPALVGLQPL